MPIDFASLTTAFSGAQLVIIVAMFMEIRSVRKDNDALKKELDEQGARITTIGQQLSHVMGRMQIGKGAI